MIYAGPTTDASSRFNLRGAWVQSEANTRAIARSRRTVYPIPHTRVVGVRPDDLYTEPDRYGTKHITAPRETLVRGEYLFEITPEMEALPAGVERVDGEDVSVVRAGTVRSEDIFRAL